MGLTRLELRDVRGSVEYWAKTDTDAPEMRYNAQDHRSVASPPYVLAYVRASFALLPYNRLKMAFTGQAEYAKWERSLALGERNAIAVAFYDWVEWLRSKGLEMGICTAILSGKRDDVLRLIDDELKDETKTGETFSLAIQ
jgi:hypothetical protein